MQSCRTCRFWVPQAADFAAGLPVLQVGECRSGPPFMSRRQWTHQGIRTVTGWPLVEPSTPACGDYESQPTEEKA
jgi:hypothetical protein